MPEQDGLFTPSYHGELCRYNGENPDYEIACEECNFYLLCFPDWEDFLGNDTAERNYGSWRQAVQKHTDECAEDDKDLIFELQMMKFDGMIDAMKDYVEGIK